MEFNKTQQEAIRYGEGACIVLAGPGSGKTTVITNRIRYLIEENNVNPADILVITFTKAAAKEMQTRFMNMCRKRLPVTFGTFHAVYFSILKAAYNYSVDSVISEEDKAKIVRQSIERSEEIPDDINEYVNQVLGEISRVKTEGVDINYYNSFNCSADEFKRIFKEYNNVLRKTKKIDFDDMLLFVYELFRERKDVLAKWQSRYKYILIDEFQDINKVQYEVIRLLAAPENNIFIVGDDDQSIYGFRGSKPEIMLNFEKDYEGAKRITLDINYRSAGYIVEAANKVIKHNKTRFDKDLNTVNGKGEKVDIIEFDNITDEYDRVINDIKEGVKKNKCYSDYAVLFRTNRTSSPLVRKLMEHNIPFTLKDGIPNIYEHWIAKDILTYMAMANGSRKRSDFIQIMNKPLRYISRDYVTDSEIDFDELEKYYEDKSWMMERIAKMASDIKLMSIMPCFAMINYIRKGVGYDDYLIDYAKSHSLEEAELFDLLDEITDSSKNCQSYDDFIKYIEKYTKNLKESYVKKNDEDVVTLTTMHSSKGLEYDTVYIIDANEKITPHKKAVFDWEIEEERRMFYVAMTRAKNKLKILYSNTRYNKKLECSRFVNEIMENSLKK